MKTTLFQAIVILALISIMGTSLILAFSFDDMEKLEAAEQEDLLELAKQAARNEHFSRARDYLQQARNKSYNPKAVEAAESVYRSDYAAYEERQRREEAERQAQLAREEAARSGRGAIRASADMRNWCLGAANNNIHNCYSINDSDLKNACLGMTQYQAKCYEVNNDDIKNLCLATTQFPSFCYKISNNSIKQACLGMVESSHFCYNSSGDYKLLCAGVSMSDNNCYNIR